MDARLRLILLLVPLLLALAAPAAAQEIIPPTEPAAGEWQTAPLAVDASSPMQSAPPIVEPAVEGVGTSTSTGSTFTLPDLTDRDNLAPAIQIIVMLTVLSLAPAILVMCTSFTRIIIVFSLLRQALGTPTLPPNQVLTGLALFMTVCVMAPTWKKVNDDSVQPYLAGEMTQAEAWDKAITPMREFMLTQIIRAENDETIFTIHGYAAGPNAAKIETYGDIPTTTLVPAFVLSELKVGFLMGFKIYLPFLVIDMVISAVLISMGMMMLPPVLISLPFKLLLFVLVDGWTLIVASLMASFAVAGTGLPSG